MFNFTRMSCRSQNCPSKQAFQHRSVVSTVISNKGRILSRISELVTFTFTFTFMFSWTLVIISQRMTPNLHTTFGSSQDCGWILLEPYNFTADYSIEGGDDSAGGDYIFLQQCGWNGYIAAGARDQLLLLELLML